MITIKDLNELSITQLQDTKVKHYLHKKTLINQRLLKYKGF